MKIRNAGFTLIEMLLVIVIFSFVLAGTSQMFVSTLTTQRQQSRIAETNIEGIIGLELFRQDIGKAGYGLPWNGLTAYTEADGNPYSLNGASMQAPRGIVSANNVAAGSAVLGTDYLVIRATNVATNAACRKWTFLSSGATGTTTTWAPVSENLTSIPDDNRVIVLSPGVPTSSVERILKSPAAGALFSDVANFADSVEPSAGGETRIVYGVDNDTNLRMPFNRADYYVRIPTEMPQRCAEGTGNLYKAVVNQGGALSGGALTYMPLLDCVADMQVIYRYDTGTGVLQNTDDIQTSPAWTAQVIRDQVKEVRVYILAQEGQRDTTFTFSTNPIYVGEDATVGSSLGRSFGFSGITDWQNYRWKIYTLVVKLENLNE
jgi:prepilin-type N-terminal cleavage/methylation domain-containing protein